MDSTTWVLVSLVATIIIIAVLWWSGVLKD